MKIRYLIVLLIILAVFSAYAQKAGHHEIPAMPDPVARKATLEHEWAAMRQSPHQLGVRDGYLFLLDALDSSFLNAQQVEWVLKELQTRGISDTSAPSYGNMYWGWHETGGDVGDGNNVQFCVQYGILIKILFDDRLSPDARKTLDQIFELALKGIRTQKIRISYTNIYLMRIWNMAALGQVYNQPSVVEEGRKFFDSWLNHAAQFGNREYDSPTYCGVDLESLLLIHRFSADTDIRAKANDAIQFFLNDLCSHYNEKGGFLGGAHSRDYNRVFGRDLLEEKYLDPLLGKENRNTHLFHQVCLAELQKIGLSPQQKELMNRKNRFIVQRWDSLAHTYACDFVGNKVSIASSNQSYSPDDKAFVIYLSSNKIPQMLNIAYNMEGRDDHYGTWANDGMGEKMKHLMPANYPSNGGWGKARHLMYFMQSAQNKGEFVMLALGEKDHNCIRDYLNSTIILPNTFDEIWLGNNKISIPAAGQAKSFDQTNTFMARFEDAAIAIRILWDNAGQGVRMALYNDGFIFRPGRENFTMANSSGLRLTLQHPGNGKGAIAMWWKTEEGIKTEADFKKFREKILNTPVIVDEKDGILDISVKTPLGNLGVKTDITAKKRMSFYNPSPLPDNFLFNVDGVETGRPIMDKYKLNNLK